MVSATRTCDTCVRPLAFGTTMLNSAVCAGFRQSDNCIWTVADCRQWKSAPRQWTIAQAMAFAAHVGISMSRPTLIKMCKTRRVGHQISGRRSRWTIHDPAGFKKVLKALKEQEP